MTTVAQIAKTLKMNPKVVRRILRQMPGVKKTKDGWKFPDGAKAVIKKIKAR